MDSSLTTVASILEFYFLENFITGGRCFPCYNRSVSSTVLPWTGLAALPKLKSLVIEGSVLGTGNLRILRKYALYDR